MASKKPIFTTYEQKTKDHTFIRFIKPHKTKGKMSLKTIFKTVNDFFTTTIPKSYKKTILVLLWKDLNHPYAGGGIIYAFKQAETWKKKGYRVIFLTPNFKGSKPFEMINNIEVYRVGSKYSSYILFPLWYFFHFRNKIDYIVDIENGIPYFSPLFSRKPKILLVLHIQREILFRELPFYIAWFPYILEIYLMPLVYRKTKIITISNATKNDLMSLGFKEENITISYCGFDSTLSKSRKKTDKPTIFYIGRIEKYKRVDHLIKLFEKLNNPEAELIIGGSGRQIETIKTLTENSKCKNQIKILGRISEEKKFELYGTSWLCVSASAKEGWGMTVIEGNACNTPTLAYNIPGFNESIANGINGILVENDEEFIATMNKILKKEITFGDLPAYAEKYTWENSSLVTLNVMTNGESKK